MNLLRYYQSSSWRNNFRILALATLFCCALIAFRLVWFQNWMYLFLVWNLFLAGLPLVCAFCFNFYCKTFRKKYLSKCFLFSMWLLFFPNAPYIITDLVHLRTERPVPFWFDSSIVFCAAFTGLAMGMISLNLIHEIIAANLNRWISRGVIVVIMILSSFGVYMGRVLRWNSWDVFTRPFEVLESVFQSLAKPSALAMTTIFSIMLLITYYFFKSIKERT